LPHEYYTESDIEIGAKLYLFEGVLRVSRVRRSDEEIAKSGGVSFPEDTYKDHWEIVVQKAFEYGSTGKPYPVDLRALMRKHGTMIKTKMESDYMARAEAAEESRAERHYR